MKYKELHTGDWFSWNGHYWIRTELDGEFYNLNMDNSIVFGTLDEFLGNPEVDFIARHTVVRENRDGRILLHVWQAPVLEPVIDVETNDVMVFRYFNEELHSVIVQSAMGNELGKWKFIENTHKYIRTTPTFEYRLEE